MLLRSISSALILATAANAQEPNYFITFGDSYSQTGFEISGEKPSPANPLGNPPLPGWTASGGLDWVGFMVTEFNTSLTYSYNFAHGGATVDGDIVPPYDPATVRSLIDQVQIFSDNLAEKPDYAPWTAENTVAGVWMGVNDVGNSWYLENSTDINVAAVDVYFEQLQILYDAGIRQFVILNVPPTDKTPAMIDNGEPLIQAIAHFNDLIESHIDDFKSSNGNVTAKLVDTHLPFNTAIENPEEYGAPDALCYDEDGTSCLWFNDYHPGVEIQRLVGAQVAQTWGNGFFQCVDSAMCSTG